MPVSRSTASDASWMASSSSSLTAGVGSKRRTCSRQGGWTGPVGGSTAV